MVGDVANVYDDIDGYNLFSFRKERLLNGGPRLGKPKTKNITASPGYKWS